MDTQNSSVKDDARPTKSFRSSLRHRSTDMKINQSTNAHVSGAAYTADDIGASTSRSPLRRNSLAPHSSAEIEGIERRRSTIDVSSTSLLAPRARLLEAPERSLTDLPQDLQLAIADRAGTGAIPLAMSSKTMLESTSSMAAKTFLLKRLDETDAAEVVRDVLHQATHNMPDFDAEMRSEILRGVARRIQWTEEDQQDILLDEFLMTLGKLNPQERTDALMALARLGLERGPQGLSRLEKILAVMNHESLARRAAPLAALIESLADGLAALSETGSDDADATSLGPDQDEEQHLGLEIEQHFEPNLHPEPEVDLPPEVEPEWAPPPHMSEIYTRLQQSIETIADGVVPEEDAWSEPSEIGSDNADAPSLGSELEADQHLGPEVEQHLALQVEQHLAQEVDQHLVLGAGQHFELDLLLEPEAHLPPVAEPEPSHLFEIYTRLQQSIEALGGRADAAEPLSMLAKSLRLLGLRDQQQFEAFAFIAREVERLPANFRTSALEELAKLVPELEGNYLRGFRQVAAAIEKLGPEHAGAALEILIVGSLSSYTSDAISRLVEKMPPEPRASMLANLVRQIKAHQESERVQLRALIQQAIERLPGEFQGIVLAARATPSSKKGQPAIEEQRFDDITSMVGRLAAEHRAEALAAHASGIANLAQDKRQPRLYHLLTLCEQVPAHKQGKPLSKVIRNIQTLPDARIRDHLWQKAMRTTEETSPEGRAECIAELANQIRNLSPSLREEALETLSGAAEALPRKHRRSPIHAIASAISKLPNEARQEAFDRTLGMLGEVPVDDRVFVLATLVHTATQLPEVPTSKGHPGSGPARAFDALLQSIEVLSDTDRAYALGILTRAQGDVVEKGQLVDHIFEAINRLPVEKRGRPLTLLLDTLEWSSGDLMNRQLGQALSILDELHEDDLGMTLGTLAARLPVELLAAEVREHAMTHLLRLAERVPRRDMELPLLGLATILRNIPEPRQMEQAFDRLLDMTSELADDLPEESIGALLAELALHIQALPDHAQISSAWKRIQTLCLGRALGGDDGDKVVEGLVSAAPWLEHSVQVKAVDFLLTVIKGHLTISNRAIAALAHAIPNLAPGLRTNAFEVALEKVRPHNSGVAFQRLKRDTLDLLARAAGSLPGQLLSRKAVGILLDVTPSLESQNDKKDVLITLARETLPLVLKQRRTIPDRLGNPTRAHTSRAQLLQRFIDEVNALRPTVRLAALEQMISDADHSASMGTGLKLALQIPLRATLSEIRRSRRQPQAV